MQRDENKRIRNVRKTFRVTQEENELINDRLKEAKQMYFQDYARKMCLQGKIVQVDFEQLKYIASEIRRTNLELNKITNNVKNITDKVGLSNQISLEELEDLNSELNRISAKTLLSLNRKIKNMEG